MHNALSHVRRGRVPFPSWQHVAAISIGCLLLLQMRPVAAQDRAADTAAQAATARAESLAAAVQAQRLLNRHDTLGAMAAAYRGLPEFNGPGWPDVPQTRQALLSAYAASHLVAAYDRKASAAALARDGKRIAIALNDGVEIRALDPDARVAFLRLPVPPADSDDAQNTIAYLDVAADGRRVLAATINNYYVWRLDGPDTPLTGSCGDLPSVDAARFIGNGDHVLIKCGTDLKILAAADLHPVLALHDVNAFDPSPDGRLIATDKDVRTIADGKIVLALPPSDDLPVFIAFAPDGRSLALARRMTVTIWNVASASAGTPAAPQTTIEVQSPVGVSWITYSPDGKSLITINYGEIRVWDVEGGNLTAVWADNRINLSAETPGPDRAYVSADGRWLLTASNFQDGMYTAQSTIWSVLHLDARPIRVTRGGSELLADAFTHGSAPLFATVEPDSARGGVFVWSAESTLALHRWGDQVLGSVELMAAATRSNDLILKNPVDASLTRCRFGTFACGPAPASALEALDGIITTPDGKALLSLQGQTLVATSLKDGTVVWRRNVSGDDRSGDFKVFDGGAYVLWGAGVGNQHPTLIALRAADGVPAHFFADTSSVTPLAGPVVVAQAAKGFALVNLDTGRSTPLDLPGDFVGPVAVTRDGARAAIVTSFDQSVEPARPGQFLSVVALADGRVEHSRRLALPDFSNVALVGFSPDGKDILASDQIIDAASGQRRAVLAADTDIPVFSSQYSPDGRLIFATSDAGAAHSTTLRIYSADGMLLQTFLTSVSLFLQFSADGNAFALQDYDGLGIYLTPNPDAISARARRLLDSAGLLAPR